MIKAQYILIIAALGIAAACSPEGKKQQGSSKDPNVRTVKEFYPDGRLKSSTEALGKLRHGESKQYRKDGTLESLITYQNNQKHGPALSYYSDGKTVKTEIHYENGLKEGEARWSYPNGKLYRLTPYLNGKIDGTRKVYYKTGTLQAEIPYKSGEIGTGLIEYNPDGSEKSFSARIEFSEKDLISLDNTFILNMTVSGGRKNVEFFKGELSDGRFWNDQLVSIPTENGIGRLEFYVSKGSFKMETLNIVARVKTSLNNYQILHREYHLAVENKF